MGKDKSKKRSRDESDVSSGSSDSAEEERKHREHKKHKKSKKESKHKKHKEKEKGKEKDADMIKQAKEFLKSHLTKAGGASGSAAATVAASPQALQLKPTLPEDKCITEDDYFAKNAEFSAWLLEERRLYFNELTTEQTHELFKEFAAVWNAGQLKPQYYAGTVAAPLRRTTHQWNIKGAGTSTQGSIRGTAAFLADQKDQGAATRALEKLEQKKWRGDQKELLNELLPKATGREALVEKRIARREEARARDASPDAVRLPGGGDIYGDDDSFAAAKAREARQSDQRKGRQAVRAEQAAAAAQALQAKEDERMQQFRQLLSQGPIVIPKRQPQS